jgi:hypothetical protein
LRFAAQAINSTLEPPHTIREVGGFGSSCRTGKSFELGTGEAQFQLQELDLPLLKHFLSVVEFLADQARFTGQDAANVANLVQVQKIEDVAVEDIERQAHQFELPFDLLSVPKAQGRVTQDYC